jgi:hypothetical protein
MGANAQTAVPAFVSGEVLTAAEMTQVNTGIPVFATTVTRDAAFGGTGEKVLAQGQHCYLESTSALQVYTGSAWVNVGDGLSLITAQTIGTAVSSVTVTGVFSSSFDAYKVIVSSGVGSSNNAQLFLTLGATATGYEWGYVLTNTGATVGSSTTTGTYVPVGEINNSILQGSFEIINPNLAKNSYFNATIGWNLVNSNSRAGLTGVLKDTTAYTAFTLTASAGTLTGGTIRVYGYKN